MTRLGVVASNLKTATRAREFCSLARCIMLAKDAQPMRGEIARQAGLSSEVVSILEDPAVPNLSRELHLAQRAAVVAGTTTDTTWGAPLADYAVLAGAFLESLRHFSAFDKLLPNMRVVPFRTRVGSSSVGISGTTTGQASAKPIGRLTLSGTMIAEQKIAAVVILTEEVVRFGSKAAGDLFAAELSAAVGVETDSRFIAILTAGATTITSSGVTSEHVLADLRALLANITTSARSSLFLLMPPAISKTLSVLHTSAGSPAFENARFNGGELAGIPIVPTDGAAAGTILLVDTAQLACASETVTLDAARAATVQMDSAPDSPTSASTNLASLWQSNLAAIKAERFFGCEKLTTTGVAVLTNVAYVGDSPGP